MIKVTVRWHDGHLENFKCSKVRAGSDLLWMRLLTGQNRNIPLRSVRWFSRNPESYENQTLDTFQKINDWTSGNGRNILHLDVTTN